jgi:hypothetical protein
MQMEWIRAKDLPNIYPIKKTYAYDLLRQFRAESDGWIKDGRVLIVKKEEFERWWKNKGNRQSA